MKHKHFPYLLLPILASCEAIKGIFKAGVWTGILFVVAVIAIIILVISKVMGKKS